VNGLELLQVAFGTGLETGAFGVDVGTAVFALGVALGIANLAGYLASALGWSTYWPLGDRDRWYYVHWSISVGLNGCLVIVTVLDWGSIPLPRPHTTVIGAVLFVPFWLAGIWAGNDLGSDETMGLRGELRTDGWYRYSRNPQYTCYLVATVGFVLLASSWQVTVLCGLLASWWFVMPFAEEPWLREQYGEAYDRYCDRVPRFLGRRTISGLVPSASGTAET
jgi:protein-S-isoprenylcysteine O-methyltransferase Ste14